MRTLSAVVLWNARGKSLSLPPGEWDAALALATSLGWRGGGTRKPPVSLEPAVIPSWDGRYSPALGQEVTAADARQLAYVLGALAAQSPVLANLTRFADNGGFLVCAAAGQERTSSFSAQITSLATALAGTRSGAADQTSVACTFVGAETKANGSDDNDSVSEHTRSASNAGWATK